MVAIALLVILPIAARAQQPPCEPMPPAAGSVFDIGPSDIAVLQSILDRAQPGDAVQLADGVYALPQTLVLRRPGVTLRSKSGHRDAVVIDGRYTVQDLLLIQESDVTIADVTLTRSSWHLVHVVPERKSIAGTVLHNLRGVDGGEQFTKVNPAGGHHADAGTIRCSRLELTDEGRANVRNNCYTGGIDIHQGRGWHITSNMISGFWCASGLSEHAIHVWAGSRDTLVERNVVADSARGIGFGLGASTAGRTYADAPCDGAPMIGHYGGAILNNFVMAIDQRLFGSAAGFDVGIGLEQSCRTSVLHNTVVSTRPPRSSSIEWRFPYSIATIANNLASHSLLERNGGRAVLGGNVEKAPVSLFANILSADLHLVPDATMAIDRGVPVTGGLEADIDGDRRDERPDVGADEYVDRRERGSRR